MIEVALTVAAIIFIGIVLLILKSFIPAAMVSISDFAARRRRD